MFFFSQSRFSVVPPVLAVCLWLAGCMTPDKAVREADETATAAATEVWRAQTGLTNAFDIARPADVLTLRIALEALRQGTTNAVFPRIAGVAPLAPSNGTLRLSLESALRLGARNNRKYQTLKEAVYQKALALDDARYAFDNTFSGFLLGALTGSPEIDKEGGQGGAGVRRKFVNGATLAGNMAVDVTKMIREDWHSFGWTGDLTASVPLLRGSAREIVREPLTQAERNLAYALLTFSRYRETYALSIAKAYYRVLQYAQTRRNSDDNARRLDLNWRRAEMMFKAGRMDRIQVDQARTDLLAAHQTIITAQQNYEDALDNFKITLGLAPEAPVALDDAELVRIQAQMAAQAATEEEIRGLFAILDRMKRGQTRFELMSVGHQFHLSLAQLAHNRVLYGFYVSAASQMRSMRVLGSLTLEVYRSGIHEHAAIAEAIAHRDGALAAQRMREHLQNDYGPYLSELTAPQP